ncbi:MAG: hypothetical protein K8L99_06130 [Anaerolineae bacterium]|nr:hypothetical protein [Anaerolineae bacterium]
MAQDYEIRIKGHLDETWADWLSGLTIRHEANGESLLTGSLPDQAALHGLLNRLRDLGIELISVNPAGGAPVPVEDDDE